LPVSAANAQAGDPVVFINEIHYDNAGTDVGEFVEVAGPVGTDLTGWTLVFYNGTNTPTAAPTYRTASLPAGRTSSLFTVVELPTDGIQNGGADGLALVNGQGGVVQFLSYEGVITASNGPAAGLTSTDIGVTEPGTTPIGHSLQLTAHRRLLRRLHLAGAG
jgi:hypothetical protein